MAIPACPVHGKAGKRRRADLYGGVRLDNGERTKRRQRWWCEVSIDGQVLRHRFIEPLRRRQLDADEHL